MPDDEHKEPEEDELEKRFREIEERAAALKQEHAAKADLGDDTHAALEEIERKAAALRATQEKKTTTLSEQRRVDSESSRGLGIGMTVAYIIVGIPLAGAGLGYLIDKALKASIFMGIGTLIGAIIGISMTVVIVNREANKKP
jgi:F0F1-type ATP synthase assembly protein I